MQFGEWTILYYHTGLLTALHFYPFIFFQILKGTGSAWLTW